MKYTRMTLYLDNVPYDSPSMVDEIRDITKKIDQLGDPVWLEGLFVSGPGEDFEFRLVLGLEVDDLIQEVKDIEIFNDVEDDWVVEEVEE